MIGAIRSFQCGYRVDFGSEEDPATRGGVMKIGTDGGDCPLDDVAGSAIPLLELRRRPLSAGVLLPCQLLLAGLLCVVGPAAASEGWTDYRRVLDFGCHRQDGTCYVTVEGAPVGASTCTSTSIRWNSKDDVNGKNWLALIMFAKATGKRVGFYVSGCYLPQPVFPTFGHGSVEP